MRGGILFLALAAACASGLWDKPEAADGDLRYTKDNQMIYPANYRDWIWLSSGLGMTYHDGAGGDPQFDNVFVSPAAYRGFLTTGTWPDRTVLVLENRAAESKGSINKGGHYQGQLAGVEAHVKDKRFKGQWAFYAFGKDGEAARPIPHAADCYFCHEKSAAVDTTFVQFYPTLLQIAMRKNTLRAGWQTAQ